MGSITDGVMAGLRIRESRRQFEAKQQHYAAQSEREARIDKIAEETRSYERGKSAYDHFERDLDRLTNDSAQTIDQYFKAGEAVRQAQMAVSMASPMKGLQGDSSYEIAARGLQEAMEAQAAIRGVATEQKSRISTIRSAMDRISMMRPPSNDAAVGDQKPSGGGDLPADSGATIDYAQPAYASPRDRTSRDIPRTDMQDRGHVAPILNDAPPDISQGNAWTPGTAGPANAHAFEQPAIPPELQRIHAALDRLVSLPIQVAADGKTLEIVATTADQAKEAERQVKDLQAQQKAQYKAAGIDIDPALPVSIRYGGEDKKAEDKAKTGEENRRRIEDQQIAWEKVQHDTYVSASSKIGSLKTAREMVSFKSLPDMMASFLAGTMSTGDEGADSKLTQLAAALSAAPERKEEIVKEVQKVYDGLIKERQGIVDDAESGYRQYQSRYKAQQARLKEMGIEVTSKKDRFYLEYVFEHFDGKSIIELTDEERGELKKAWAKQEAE